MLNKLISIVLTTTLSLGVISLPSVQPVEAHHTKAYRLRRAVGSKSSQVGIASWYGHNDGYHGRKTANGERFNKWGNTAAHRYLPFGTKVKVTNLNNGKSTVVRITDRGPFIKNRILDLSYGSFSRIAPVNQGLVRVRIEKVK